MALFLNAKAPDTKVVYLLTGEKINYYAPLIKAVAMVESSMRPRVINIEEQAYGLLQIRKCRLDSYNKLTDKDYQLTDCLNPDVAKEIFMYYTKGRDYESVARSWNGSGEMTIAYWQKVKAKL